MSIILVTGGARSGKSTFAEQYVKKYGKNVAYVATAQILDEEMQFRVDLHRKRRPRNWKSYEAPYNVASVIEKIGAENDMILLDCMTIYISNMLLSMPNVEDSEKNYKALVERIDAIIEAGKNIKGTLVVVTNEVGDGIVPENRLSREYRDLVGIANQRLAEVAEKVYMVVAGIPVDLKKIAEKVI